MKYLFIIALLVVVFIIGFILITKGNPIQGNSNLLTAGNMVTSETPTPTTPAPAPAPQNSAAVIQRFNYPDVPTTAQLASLLAGKVALNDWEFYQSFKQGLYTFPTGVNFASTFLTHPPASLYFIDVTYETNFNYTGKGKASINWHYAASATPYPDWSPLKGQWATNYAEMGQRNPDNTWTLTLHNITNTTPFYLPWIVGTKFDSTGNPTSH